MALAPGKGYHVPADANTARFLVGAHAAVLQAIELHPGEAALKHLVEENGWVAANDTFGQKAYLAFPLAQDGQELRVTVVYKKGSLFVDVRQWYTPAS